MQAQRSVARSPYLGDRMKYRVRLILNGWTRGETLSMALRAGSIEAERADCLAAALDQRIARLRSVRLHPRDIQELSLGTVSK